MAGRILMIDDNTDYLTLMTAVLGRAGYTLITARNGQEGLEKARAEKPDLILTDLMLPQLNGYEICSLLKQDLKYRRIPIVVWSATKLQDRDAKLARECGADAYLLKSVAPAALLQEIERMLAGLPRPSSGEDRGQPPGA